MKTITEVIACFPDTKSEQWHQHENGKGWVFETAFADLTSFVEGLVYGYARVYGNDWVSGNARVYGNARVSGNAWVSGNALDNGYCFAYKGNDWNVTEVPTKDGGGVLLVKDYTPPKETEKEKCHPLEITVDGKKYRLAE